MILFLWLGRWLDRLTLVCSRAADAAYRPYYRRENRRAKRDAERKAITRSIAESRCPSARLAGLAAPTNRVGSPLHRDVRKR